MLILILSLSQPFFQHVQQLVEAPDYLTATSHVLREVERYLLLLRLLFLLLPGLHLVLHWNPHPAVRRGQDYIVDSLSLLGNVVGHVVVELLEAEHAQPDLCSKESSASLAAVLRFSN